MTGNRIGLGQSDFRALREDGLAYVDKSLLIRDVLQDPAQAILLTRPRRFGKTLNLSMLRAFFEKSRAPLLPLFEGLAVAAASECRSHFQRYPTLALTFKDVKARSWSGCRDAIAQVVAALYGEHHYLLSEGVLRPDEAATFTAILEARAADALLWGALGRLSGYLFRHHRERVLILIDEYDTPLHAGFTCGYYDEAVEFFRNFLSGGLKDNPHLWKGVMTGILRVAKDSVFTGLNNLDVYSILRPEYAAAFGFTEEEVAALLQLAGEADRLPEVQAWYDGYLFGGQVVYNPWSVLSFLKGKERELRPYWVETSSNDLINDLLVSQGLGFSEDMERLLRGERVERTLSEHVALRDLAEEPDLVYSLLLFTGYLKVQGTRREAGVLYGTLAIPNEEVASIYRSLFSGWLRRGLGGERREQRLLAALLQGDAAAVAELLSALLLQSASFHDTASPPERFYHGFVLGLLASLGERYEVLSNREAGHGRCDLLLLPRIPGEPGIVMELKAVDDSKAVEEALSGALRQLVERDYAAGLRLRGARPIHEMAVVFAGKSAHAQLAAPR